VVCPRCQSHFVKESKNDIGYLKRVRSDSVYLKELKCKVCKFSFWIECDRRVNV
jgi:hypothetical protein